ncbi:PREDICTED: trans-resveratrol di-O-methyltransferase-like [Ipomoea nil]|uniref:trans-resveratrol di-O-methyltransferase-like n=1 Tax=Ipomoea nil TaxID=35883 RepID=UPI000901515E|nr:PREDICTED: trans-resveratrol di-O-methyltransferase-like [Ipomoea nil]XP_019193584.1 PREDICTED: trans-resveratrol di-O-methyltransferase-like [Ipomoea nil]
MALLPLIAEKDSEILDSQTHIWNHILNFINSGSLKCAVQLEIPDIIHKHGQPMSLTQLVNALPINNAKSTHLARLMRTLIHSGFFVITKTQGSDDEGYALAPPSILLLKDNPLSIRPLVLAILDPILTQPWHNIIEWFQNDDPTPFVTVHGMTLWDYIYARKEPKVNHLFTDAMARDSRLVMNVVIKYCRGVFEGLNSLIDVGGSTGTVATIIAHAFPHLKCTVFDLPHVVQGLEGTKNLDYVGGDMFASIPPADAVLLKWVLHDWSDEESVKILKKCKESIPSKENGGKIIIIDMVIGNVRNDEKSIETQILFDMLAMIALTGRQRAEKDWAKLFFEAGFSDYKIILILGVRSLIEAYP